jgi:hypothetical protein
MAATSKRSKLETQIRNAEIKLAHKRDVMRQHAPGTSWHTRAMKEAGAIERRLATLRQRWALA